MWSETGLMQVAGSIAAKGAGVEQPREAEGEAFGALFDQSIADALQDMRLLPTGEAPVEPWPIWAAFPSVPVALPPDAGAAVPAGDGGLQVPDEAAGDGATSGRQGKDNLMPVPPAVVAERAVGLQMAEGGATAHDALPEAAGRLVEGEYPALAGRGSGVAEAPVAGSALAVPAEAVEVSLGRAEVSGLTEAAAATMMEAAGQVPAIRSGGEGRVVVQHPETLALAEQGPPSLVAGALTGEPVVDAEDNPSAGTMVLQLRPDGASGRGAEAIPAALVPTMPTAMASPAAGDAPSRATPLAAPDTVLAVEGPQSLGQGSVLDAEDRPEVTAGRDQTPAAGEAETIWLGRLHQETVSGTVRADRSAAGATMPTTPGNGPSPYPLAVLSGAQAGSAAFAGGLAGPSLLEMVELSFADGDLGPIAFSPSGQPAFAATPAAGAPPVGAVAHLAAGVVATLQRRSDGQTEIALSPDELGSVRLRLEPDAQDPDRMIVHLVFERPETMDLFRRHADQLSEAILAAGYAEARLDFGQHGTGGEAGAGQDAEHGQGVTGGEAETISAASQAAANPGSPLRSNSSTGLDLRL